MEHAGTRSFRRWWRTCSATLIARDALALLGVGVVYWLRIYPQVRRELAAWERRARSIPDPMLREHALGQLSGERLNPEAAALFAVLAPGAQRRRVVRLIVAYQVLYDYLDAVNEEPDLADLRNGLQLHRALTDAVLPNRPVSDYYVHHVSLRGGGDGGYMRVLTGVCRQVVRTLPAAAGSAPSLAHATLRCAEAQSHNHAILVGGVAPLIQWSLAQAPDGCDYEWWELAAGGISCLAIHALLASAADPDSGGEDAAALDAAYFPAICALSSLLDSLADYHRDLGTTNHSFISHYRDSGHAAERLVAITADAADRIKPLRNSRLHAIILTGIASYYLSSPSVRDGFPAAAAERLTRHIGPLGTPMRGAMRARRRLHTRATNHRVPSRRPGSPEGPILGGPAARAPVRR
jgi:tetraprenyl-beta-curcumene synthase